MGLGMGLGLGRPPCELKKVFVFLFFPPLTASLIYTVRRLFFFFFRFSVFVFSPQLPGVVFRDDVTSRPGRQIPNFHANKTSNQNQILNLCSHHNNSNKPLPTPTRRARVRRAENAHPQPRLPHPIDRGLSIKRHLSQFRGK